MHSLMSNTAVKKYVSKLSRCGLDCRQQTSNHCFVVFDNLLWLESRKDMLNKVYRKEQPQIYLDFPWKKKRELLARANEDYFYLFSWYSHIVLLQFSYSYIIHIKYKKVAAAMLWAWLNAVATDCMSTGISLWFKDVCHTLSFE